MSKVAMPMPRTFHEDFTCVIEWLKKTYPSQWPEAEVDALTTEAKEAVRRSPETAIPFYAESAARIRAGGVL